MTSSMPLATTYAPGPVALLLVALDVGRTEPTCGVQHTAMACNWHSSLFCSSITCT